MNKQDAIAALSLTTRMGRYLVLTAPRRMSREFRGPWDLGIERGCHTRLVNHNKYGFVLRDALKVTQECPLSAIKCNSRREVDPLSSF